MRLRADIFVAALIRRAQVEGAYATLRRRGAPEAGAIFVRVDRLDGVSALFGPAPQSEIGEDGDRLFRRMHDEEWIDNLAVEERLRREMKFDPDLWIVDIEDRRGRDFLTPA
ncbi:MAG: DUF1491 family protein [Hyphomicrobiales bacterium]|nr:DUF1491 family protein [Rhodoblastus sp.]MCC0000152.1 DUF1491 family protein [Methylobacteriaceae bacterium]MCC2100862.1 DUF1491 family protein [Hyphomicrobiales bacterium]HRY02056.1 DUF1491 family protein [Beijerinckiaceae bacterium]MCB1523267.1 DUF1491 family protein [Rhodoblastus sp.]